MAVNGDGGAGRRKILLLLVLVLAVVFALQFSGLSLAALPTKDVIEQQAKELHSARKLLAKLSRESVRDEHQLAELRTQAVPFWSVASEQRADQEVMEGFARVARKAQINKQQVQNPRRANLPDYDYLYAVEFSVTLTATMKEISRLLYEMERSDHVFQWTQCSIGPANRRSPTEVRLTGRIRALVLRPEAQAILANRAEGQG